MPPAAWGGGGGALVADDARDVVVLGGAAGWVDQADGALSDVVRVEGAGEELVVGLVDGVAALEGEDVLALWEGGAHLGGGGARKHARRLLEALHLHARGRPSLARRAAVVPGEPHRRSRRALPVHEGVAAACRLQVSAHTACGPVVMVRPPVCVLRVRDTARGRRTRRR